MFGRLVEGVGSKVPAGLLKKPLATINRSNVRESSWPVPSSLITFQVRSSCRDASTTRFPRSRLSVMPKPFAYASRYRPTCHALGNMGGAASGCTAGLERSKSTEVQGKSENATVYLLKLVRISGLHFSPGPPCPSLHMPPTRSAASYTVTT